MLQSQMADLFKRQYAREQLPQRSLTPKLDFANSNSSSTSRASRVGPLDEKPDSVSKSNRKFFPQATQKIRGWLNR